MSAGEPVDPDAPVPDLPRRGRWRGTEGPVLAVVAAGGVVGALARFGAGRAWPTHAGTFPWTTFAVNVVGCAAIGVLLVLVSEVWRAHRLWRPLLGTGVLGGCTTFSTYAVDADHLLRAGRPLVAVLYLAGTLASALAAVVLAARATRWATSRPGAR